METIVLMAQKQKMPQFYYWVVHRIHVSEDMAELAVKVSTGTGNRRIEGIIYPHKSGNLQNYFASFRHYSYDAILCMSLLHLFLIINPEDYLEEVLITETNKGLSVPMDIQEFIKWVGCWLYMA